MSAVAPPSTPLVLYVLENSCYFTCSLHSNVLHNIGSSLLMEAIHHGGFKGYTPDLCFTVTLPDSSTMPAICPRPSTSVTLYLAAKCLCLWNTHTSPHRGHFFWKGNSSEIRALLMFLSMLLPKTTQQIFWQTTCTDSTSEMCWNFRIYRVINGD